MQAFHNNPELKQQFVANALWHQEQDKLVQGLGRYTDEQKGCMIACSFKSYDHSLAPKEAGVPEWLAQVADTIFEGLPVERAKKWTEQFWSAINVGADLEKVKTPFIIFILEQNLNSMNAVKYDAEKFPHVVASVDQVKSAIVEMIRYHKENLDLSAARSATWLAWSAAGSAWSATWSVARSTESATWSVARSSESAASLAARSAAVSAAESAESAAWSTESAAVSAAWSAESAARSAARSAAESAAESAESVAWSTESAAWSAAWSADSAAWSAAWSAAQLAAYEIYADKLLQLIRETV